MSALAAAWGWIVAVWRSGSTPAEPTEEDREWDEVYWQVW